MCIPLFKTYREPPHILPELSNGLFVFVDMPWSEGWGRGRDGVVVFGGRGMSQLPGKQLKHRVAPVH